MTLTPPPRWVQGITRLYSHTRDYTGDVSYCTYDPLREVRPFSKGHYDLSTTYVGLRGSLRGRHVDLGSHSKRHGGRCTLHSPVPSGLSGFVYFFVLRSGLVSHFVSQAPRGVSTFLVHRSRLNMSFLAGHVSFLTDSLLLACRSLHTLYHDAREGSSG